jgi:hypothetical protein
MLTVCSSKAIGLKESSQGDKAVDCAEATPLHDLDTAGDRVGIRLGPRSDDAGVPGRPSALGLAPETRGDGRMMQNL